MVTLISNCDLFFLKAAFSIKSNEKETYGKEMFFMVNKSTSTYSIQTMKKFKKRLYENRYLYLIFMLPFLYYIVFKYGAMSWLLLAFKDFNARAGLWGSDWVGFEHFISFFETPDFFRLLRNTVLLSVYNIIFAFPIPIILALMINDVKQAGFKKAVQSITYLPHFFSIVIICGMVVNFLTSEGLINQIIMFFGGESVNFLTNPDWFRPIYIISGIWQTAGWSSIMYLAALTGIDPQLYESAVIDGASKLQQTVFISIPSIAPIISIQLLLSIGGILSVGYEKIILLYNGATYETADVISTYVYRRGLVDADYGYGTAVSLFQAIISLILIISANKAADKIGQTSLW